MHTAARDAWLDFIRAHEGEVPYMYLDTKGLVTVGIGNLIDPVASAIALPFQTKSQNKLGAPAGRPATPSEIEVEWHHIKHHTKCLAMAKYGHTLCAPETNLELSQSSRDKLFWDKSDSNESVLHETFRDYDAWPADAQLGLMALAWGLGPGFPAHWNKFTAACKARDFATAAAESHISSWNADRNGASQRFFRNAARVHAGSETIAWPSSTTRRI